jgi:hypothetical protein
MGLIRTRRFWAGALALSGGIVFLGVDFTGPPPRSVWVWAVKDARFPEQPRSLEDPYDSPGGARIEGWIAEATPPGAGGLPGLRLRKRPGPRERLLLTIGIRADTLDRWHTYAATAKSAGAMQGTFWELRRGK